MKYQHKILFIVISLVSLAFSCNNRGLKQSKLKELKKNNYDFPELIQREHNDVSFQLSKWFTKSYNDNYVIQDNALTETVQNLGVHFSFETFNKSDIEKIIYFQERTKSEDEALDVLKYYIKQRTESMYESFLSDASVLPENTLQNGYYQTIHTSEDAYSDGTTYIIASIKRKNEVHVLQMIAASESMTYLFDDFMRIIQSMR